MIDCVANFFTDAATLALFDPAVLARRVEDKAGWWCGDFALLDEVRSGQAAIIGLGGDGIYRLRVTDQALTFNERDYAAEVVRALGVDVQSGNLFAGPGECLPGGEHALDDTDLARGALIHVPNGRYLVDVFAIYWFESPIWWRESGDVPDDAPPDYVACLRRSDAPYLGLESIPRFTSWPGRFLFPSVTRRVGPEPGMILTTKARKNPTGELTLANCGPGNYSAYLRDYSMLKWSKTIRFRVLSVDTDSRSMQGEFLEFVD
jgi:hypothetical protein